MCSYKKQFLIHWQYINTQTVLYCSKPFLSQFGTETVMDGFGRNDDETVMETFQK